MFHVNFKKEFVFFTIDSYNESRCDESGLKTVS